MRHGDRYSSMNDNTPATYVTEVQMVDKPTDPHHISREVVS